MDEYKIEMQEEVGSSAIREIDLDGETREHPAKPLRMRETDEPANVSKGKPMFPLVQCRKSGAKLRFFFPPILYLAPYKATKAPKGL